MTSLADNGLRIEDLTVAHAPMLFAALDDPRVGLFIGGPDVTSLEALRARITRRRFGPPPPTGQTWLNFAVLSGPTVVGRVEATLHDGIAEIAYVIGPAHWGRGLGVQATGLLLDRLASMGIADAWAATHPGNHASMTVLTRLGFEECEPTLAPHLLSYDAGDRVFSRSCQGAR